MMAGFGTSLDIGDEIEKDEELKKRIEDARCGKCGRGEAVSAQRILNEIEKEKQDNIDKWNQKEEEEIEEENVEPKEEGDEDRAFVSLDARKEKEALYQAEPEKEEDGELGEEDDFVEEPAEEETEEVTAEDELDVREIIQERHKQKKEEDFVAPLPFKTPKWVVPLFIILLIIMSFWVLSAPQNLASVDAKAQQIIEQRIANEVVQKVNAEWMMLSQAEKDKKVNEELVPLLASSGTKKDTDALAKQFRAFFSDKSGLAYNYNAEVFKHMTAAMGAGESTVAGFIAGLFSVWSIFANISLEKAAFFLPVLLGLVSVVLFFFVVKKISNSSAVGFLGALLLLMSHVFLVQNLAGNVGVPMLAVFSTILFAFLIICGIAKKKNFRSFICVFLAVLSAILFLKSGLFGLESAGFKAVIAASGGKVLALLAGIMLIWLLFKNFKKRNKYEIFAIAWLLLVAVLSIVFPPLIYVLSPAAILLAALFIGKIHGLFSGAPEALGLNLKKEYAGVFFTILFAVLIFVFLTGPQSAGLPDMNDAVYNTAVFVKTNSSGSVVNAWPDYSEMIKYYSRTAVVSDKTQIAKALMAVDEAEAVKILKELDANYSSAFFIVGENELGKIGTIANIAFENEIAEDFLVSQVIECTQRDALYCGSAKIDLKAMDAKISDSHPAGLLFFGADGAKQVEYNDSQASFVVVVFESKDGIQAFFVDKRLKDSMLVKLFAGAKLEQFSFEFASRVPERIAVWKTVFGGVNVPAEKVNAAVEKEIAPAEKEEAKPTEAKQEQKTPVVNESDLSSLLAEGLV